MKNNNVSMWVAYKLKKCSACHKKAIIIILDNDIGYGLCKKHFFREFPHYTLGDKCLICKRNFNCNIQELIFTKKEIKEFKKELEKYPEIEPEK